VKVWASIIKRLLSHESSSEETSINTFYLDNNIVHEFTGTELLKRLRAATTSIGPDTRGFTAKQIGLHSARSGAAVAMYLAGVPVFTIMMLGCWSSDAFLRYIRNQVKEFSTGISKKMIQNENFSTVPPASNEDPRNANNIQNSASHQINGLCFKDTIRPLVHVFHGYYTYRYVLSLNRIQGFN
jgi:hypothetical protein